MKAKYLNLEGKKFVKMGIIESEQMDNLTNTSGKIAKENTTRYSFVAIASDGTVVPMELRQGIKREIIQLKKIIKFQEMEK